MNKRTWKTSVVATATMGALLLALLIIGCDSGASPCQTVCDRLINECLLNEPVEICLDHCENNRSVLRSNVFSGLVDWAMHADCGEATSGKMMFTELIALCADISDSVISDFVASMCSKMVSCNPELSQETCAVNLTTDMGQEASIFKAGKPEKVECVINAFAQKDCTAINEDKNSVIVQVLEECDLHISSF